MSYYLPFLLEEFECPVCTEYMHAPIRQCETGHSICQTCFDRMRICPVCKAPKVHGRNFALEHLQLKLAFPCKNRSEGCLFVDLGTHILEHEDHCPYADIPCLLRTTKACAWNGGVSSFMAHCKSQHPDNIYTSGEDTVTCVDFTKSVEMNVTSSQVVIQAGKEAFKCVWAVNHESGLMRWCVFYIGLEKSPKDYSYEITIVNHNINTEKLTIRGTCKHFKQEQSVFKRNMCMFTNFNMLKKFCDGNDLKYNVKIHRNYFPR